MLLWRWPHIAETTGLSCYVRCTLGPSMTGGMIIIIIYLHCPLPSSDFVLPEWVLSRGIRAAAPCRHQAGETAVLQWPTSGPPGGWQAVSLTRTRNLSLGFVRFLLTLTFLLLSLGCMCIFHKGEPIPGGIARSFSPLLSPVSHFVLQCPSLQDPHCRRTAPPMKREGGRPLIAKWGGNRLSLAPLGQQPQPGPRAG